MCFDQKYRELLVPGRCLKGTNWCFHCTLKSCDDKSGQWFMKKSNFTTLPGQGRKKRPRPHMKITWGNRQASTVISDITFSLLAWREYRLCCPAYCILNGFIESKCKNVWNTRHEAERQISKAMESIDLFCRTSNPVNFSLSLEHPSQMASDHHKKNIWLTYLDILIKTKLINLRKNAKARATLLGKREHLSRGVVSPAEDSGTGWQGVGLLSVKTGAFKYHSFFF